MRIFQRDEIDDVAVSLLKGDIVAFGTDTVFGLACIYDNEEAIEKIYKAKGRREDKPLPMMCSDISMMTDVSYLGAEAEKIINRFVPGPLTIVLKKKNLADYITHGFDTIGIRIPDDEWILKLIDKVGKPLLVTSANLSDQGSLHKYVDVYNSLNGRIDGIVEGDARGEGASTVISLLPELKILREGPISREDLLKCLEDE